jgi:dTDP-4-amino-4,6-dideoxygalactose transaminase
MIKYLGKKNIINSEINDILSISHKSNHFANNGPVKNILERKIEEVLSISSDKRVVCLNNGTSSLHAIMFLCKQKYNVKKWAIPSFNFPSALVGGAFDVDALDVSKESYTIDMNKKSLDKYDGIILTNLFGTYSNLYEWEKFCKDNKKILIFDNASSPLSVVGNKNICSFGDYSFSSLHHTKILGFGEGGFAVVPKEEYGSVNAISGFGYLEDKVYSPLSSNFKISDVSSAYILSHIRNFPIAKYMDIQNNIIDKLSKVGVTPFNYRPGTVYGSLPVLFEKRVEVDHFDNYNIEVKKYYKPLLGLENSLDIYSRIINFPLHTDLSESDINDLVEIIRETF